MAKFTVGHEKKGGRKKGVGNRITGSVKEVLQLAFDELGGLESLVRFGRKQPAAFYQIWAKLLPKQIEQLQPEECKMIVTEVVVRSAEEVAAQK